MNSPSDPAVLAMAQEPELLAHHVARYRALAAERADAALDATLIAADALVERLTARLADTRRARQAYQDAVTAECETRIALSTVLRTVADLVSLTSQPTSHRHDDRTDHGRRARPADDGMPTAARVEHSHDRRGASGTPAACLGDDGDPASVDVGVDVGVDVDVDVDVEVYLLGPFRLVVRGHPCESLHGGKAARLVRYLAFQAPRYVAREVLAELLWPEGEAETGRRNLHQAVYAIRKALRTCDPGHDHLRYDNDAYALAPPGGIAVDVAMFEARAARARTAARLGKVDEALAELESADGLYRGDLLEDSPYEEWLLAERDRLRLQFVEVATMRAELLFGQGAFPAVIDCCRKLLRFEPCDEAAHRFVMRSHLALGDRSLAIRQYQVCSTQLERELGVTPDRDTTAIYETALAR